MDIRLLHLSDLHLTTKGQSDFSVKEFNQDVVTKSMLKKIRDLCEKRKQTFDLIVITGDIAARGKREDYEIAGRFCEELLEITQVEPHLLYVIPGNHDVDRKHVKQLHIDSVYKFDCQDRINEILNDQDVSPLLKRKFSDFNDFAERVMKRRLFDGERYHFVELVDLVKEGTSLRFNIAGLNSALFCGYDGDDRQKLAFGLTQVSPAVDQLSPGSLFSLAIFHHPFSCFHPVDQVSQNKLLRNFDVILHGHLHDPANAAMRSQLGSVVIVSAGASFETRETENSFDIVKIDVESGEGEIEFYKYLSAKDAWTKNHDLNDLDEEGLFRFKLELRAKVSPSTPVIKPAAASPISPDAPVRISFIHDHLLTKSFTGRVEELDRLKQIMMGNLDPVSKNRASITAVIAIGGVGKSCLVRQVVDELPPGGRYQHVIWFSFDEARTEDVSYFFRKVLEKLAVAPETLNELKSKQLCELLCEKMDAAPVLLVLDGFEAIQNTVNQDSPSYASIDEGHRDVFLLLRHICNHDKSRVVITSRVPLKDFIGVVGYVEIRLETFSPATGASLLAALGVEGENLHLEACSRMFGGHALCLVAAGKYMAYHQIKADEVEKLTGDSHFFSQNSDGERVAKIVAAYRRDLTPEQEYFLMMLSIHPRPVSRDNFSALVRNYAPGGVASNPWDFPAEPDEVSEDGVVRDDEWVGRQIIEPLRDRGLIDLLRDSTGQRNYSAHPLMKVAYTTWMEKDQRANAHELWAEAARRSPQWAQFYFASTIEHLQIALDTVDHYLNSENYHAAWELYYYDKLAEKLDRLNYGKRELELSDQIHDAVKLGNLTLSATEQCHLYDFLARAHNKNDNQKEVLHYYEKLHETAERTGDSYYIEQSRNLLAGCYIGMGEIARGQMLAPFSKRTEGKLKLYTGDYEAAAVLLKEEYDISYEHEKTTVATLLGEALIRAGNFAEAERVLQESLEYALTSEPVFHCCAISHLTKLTMLKLKQHDIPQARHFNDERHALTKKMDIKPAEDYEFLLVAEGKYDLAIDKAQKGISTEEEAKLDKHSETRALLILAQAWHGKGDAQLARDFFNRAKTLMETTGCWAEKDRLQETESMLA